MKCPRGQPPSPGRRLIRTAPRGSEQSDELRPDCTNSRSTHADRAAAREPQVQPLKERIQQQTPERIVEVPVDTDRSPRSRRYRKQLRSQRPSTSTRSWMCQACANAKSQSSRQPGRQSKFLSLSLKTSFEEPTVAAQATDPLNCKLRRARWREFGVPDDCRQGTTAAGQCSQTVLVQCVQMKTAVPQIQFIDDSRRQQRQQKLLDQVM